MSLFALSSENIDENTDINVDFVKDIVNGINEALIIQDTGGLYFVISTIQFANPGDNYETAQGVYKYRKQISVQSYAPEGKSFKLIDPAPVVFISPRTSAPLSVSASAKPINDAGNPFAGSFDVYLERTNASSTTCQILIAGMLV